MGDLSVRPYCESDSGAWDEFVTSCPTATFFHRVGWRRILHAVFGLRPYYYLAERDGQIVGVLPLFYQRSLLFGRGLISTPFCVEGGPATSEVESDRALVEEAIRLQEKLRAPYIELRSRTAHHAGWQTQSELYATFSGPISTDEKTNLLAVPRKQRAVIRKTLESGLTSEVDEDVNQLYAIYSESVRNLGTPMFPKSYFLRLKEEFGRDCDIVVVKDRGSAVSAVLNFYFRETVLPYYGGGTIAARRSGANDFLYWEVIRRAAERGYKQFDFGRSKRGTGAFAFKKNWGFEPRWLCYEYHVAAGRSLPNKNPLNPKYSLPIEIWKRLPLPIANLLGPFIVNGLG